MVSEKDSNISRLVDHMMSQVAEVADEEDWKESDGWVGKWTIVGGQNITRVYAIHAGKFHPATPQDKYTGEVEMSEDTFLDLVAGALQGKGEATFAIKYAHNHIRYKGEHWIVDSERFRKVLRRLGSKPVRSMLGF